MARRPNVYFESLWSDQAFNGRLSAASTTQKRPSRPGRRAASAGREKRDGDGGKPGHRGAGPIEGRIAEVLTPDALEFVAALQREFNDTRLSLLARRAERRERFLAGETPDFLPETADVREGEWSVAPAA